MLKNTFDVCLTADRAYAAPTAVTARELAIRINEGVARVYFVWADVSEPEPQLCKFLDSAGVELVRMPQKLVSMLGSASIHHIPSTTLARLFLHEILKSHSIGRFLYIDGDVDLLAPLTPLTEIQLTGEEFAAVGIRDEMLWNTPPSVDYLENMRRLGLETAQGYFNAGVLLAEMSGFERVAVEAFDFYIKERKRCKYLDQDALNAVSLGRRKKLSPRFNFQKSLFNLGLEKEINPAIVHFNSFWKPWRPTPFTRTWKSKGSFWNSWSELSEIWPQTWPLNQNFTSIVPYHFGALKSEMRGKRNSQNRRAELLSYFLQDPFVDTQKNFTAQPSRGNYGH